jgi:hypothetical protein
MRRWAVPVACLGLYGLLTWCFAEKPQPPQGSASPKDAAGLVAAPAEPTLVDRLFQTVNYNGLEDPKADLGQALELLSRPYGIPFQINEKAFAYESVKEVARIEITNPNPLPPMKAPVAQVLRKVLSRIPVPSGATFMLRRNYVEITTETFLRGEVWGTPDEGPFLPIVHLDFHSRPLDQVVEELANQAKYNVVLDRTLEDGERKAEVTARLYNVPLDTALRVIVPPPNLRVAWMDNVLFITKKETAEALEKARPRRAPTKGNWNWMSNGTTGLWLPLPPEGR